MSTKQYIVTISSQNTDGETESTPLIQYEQRVQDLDIRKVIEAVNTEQLPSPAAPPTIRKRRKPRSDKGKKRARNFTYAPTQE